MTIFALLTTTEPNISVHGNVIKEELNKHLLKDAGEMLYLSYLTPGLIDHATPTEKDVYYAFNEGIVALIRGVSLPHLIENNGKPKEAITLVFPESFKVWVEKAMRTVTSDSFEEICKNTLKLLTRPVNVIVYKDSDVHAMREKLSSRAKVQTQPINSTEYFQPKPDLENHKHHFGVNNMQTQPNYNQIPQLFGTDNNTLICVELNFPKVNVIANQIFNDIIDSNFSDDVFMSSRSVRVNLAMEFGGILASIKKTLLHDMKYQFMAIILPTTPRGILVGAFKYVYSHLGFVFIEKPTNAKLIADLLTEARAESFKLISAVNLLHPAGGYQPIGGNQYPWHSNDLNSRFNTGIVPPNPFINPMYGAIHGMAMDVGRMASEQTRMDMDFLYPIRCHCGCTASIDNYGKRCEKCGTEVITRKKDC